MGERGACQLAPGSGAIDCLRGFVGIPSEENLDAAGVCVATCEMQRGPAGVGGEDSAACGGSRCRRVKVGLKNKYLRTGTGYIIRRKEAVLVARRIVLLKIEVVYSRHVLGQNIPL